MKKLISFLLIILFFNVELIAMEKRPYHHLPDGTFRNPEGSPVRANDVKFSYRTFIKEKKKIDITVPKDHVIDKKIVKENLEKFKDDDYIAWIGHATFLIKLGETTIITDPVFSLFILKSFSSLAVSFFPLAIKLLLLKSKSFHYLDALVCLLFFQFYF